MVWFDLGLNPGLRDHWQTSSTSLKKLTLWQILPENTWILHSMHILDLDQITIILQSIVIFIYFLVRWGGRLNSELFCSLVGWFTNVRHPNLADYFPYVVGRRDGFMPFLSVRHPNLPDYFPQVVGRRVGFMPFISVRHPNLRDYFPYEEKMDSCLS